MMNAATLTEDVSVYSASEETAEYVTMRVGHQMFGISVLTVQDVLRNQKIAHVPLAPKEIAGSMNLRGRIVTAIDIRHRLGIPMEEEATAKKMSVVVEYKGELFSLIVDTVGEVLSLPLAKFETSPANLSPRWREVAEGIYQLKNELLVILDVKHLLHF